MANNDDKESYSQGFGDTKGPSPCVPPCASRVGDMGEFSLIDTLTKRIRSAGNSSVLVGIGDDAAVIRMGEGKNLLVTCDMLVEDHHFIRGKIMPEQLGSKALAVSLSDIAAMGGRPRYALVSAGWPPELELEYAQGIYRGMDRLADEFEVSIIGGDTVRSPQIILDVAVIGEIDGPPITRAGARIGDLIAVTGFLGASAAGLALIKGQCGNETVSGLDKETVRSLLSAHLEPRPRVGEAEVLLRNGPPSAMIDLSDGLAGDLYHICENSGVGALLLSSQLPVGENVRQAAAALEKNFLDWALYGGEDYELLMTIPPDLFAPIKRAIDGLGTNLSVIGQVLAEDEGVRILEANGAVNRLGHHSFDHFDRCQAPVKKC